MADGFGGHAKTQSMEQGEQIFVDRERCPIQVCLGRSHQIQKHARDDPRVDTHLPASLAAATARRADGSRQIILQSRGTSVVQETGVASFFDVWG